MWGFHSQSARFRQRSGSSPHVAKGEVFIRLDVDRQKVTVFGTPEENDAHILDCIQTLGSPKGGLDLIWDVYPPTPLENIEAVAKAMDKYATHWLDV